MLRIAWMIENSLMTSALAFGFTKLERHSSRHCRSNDRTGVMPEPPAKAQMVEALTSLPSTTKFPLPR
eukprot:Skav227944  [mRNA]  locus=scaffold146:543390:543706:- [translate_table: standard]